MRPKSQAAPKETNATGCAASNGARRARDAGRGRLRRAALGRASRAGSTRPRARCSPCSTLTTRGYVAELGEGGSGATGSDSRSRASATRPSARSTCSSGAALAAGDDGGDRLDVARRRARRRLRRDARARRRPRDRPLPEQPRAPRARTAPRSESPARTFPRTRCARSSPRPGCRGAPPRRSRTSTTCCASSRACGKGVRGRRRGGQRGRLLRRRSVFDHRHTCVAAISVTGLKQMLPAAGSTGWAGGPPLRGRDLGRPRRCSGTALGQLDALEGDLDAIAAETEISGVVRVDGARSSSSGRSASPTVATRSRTSPRRASRPRAERRVSPRSPSSA